MMGDAVLLEALDMRGREPGLTHAELGAALGVKGSTLGSALNRIDLAVEPSRHDGSMPPGWWRAGLRRRGCGDA